MTARPAVTPTWGGPQTQPSSGEKAAGFSPGDQPPAQWFNWLLDNFADWVNYLDTEKLPTVTQTAAATPILGTPSTAHDQPASASNVWKLIISAALPDTTKVRLYAGDGGGSTGQWILTANAVWDPGAGAQTWSQDSGALTSSALWVVGTSVKWYSKGAGAGSWATSAWVTTSGALAVGGAITSGGAVTLAGALAAGGAGTFGGNVGVTGTLTAGATTVATLDATADIFAGDDIIATDEFQYFPKPVRRIAINPVQPGVTGINNGQYALLAAAESVNYNLRAPHGCNLGQVRIQISNTGGTAGYEIRIQRRQACTYAGTAPTFSDVATAIGTDALGITELTLDYAGLVASKDESYQLHVLCPFGSAGSLIIYACDYQITDPGPRNH